MTWLRAVFPGAVALVLSCRGKPTERRSARHEWFRFTSLEATGQRQTAEVLVNRASLAATASDFRAPRAN